MCAASDESISNLKCPDCSLSFSYLLSGAKKSFKLAFTPPPFFFWQYLLSLSVSLCLFSLPLLFYSSLPRLPHSNTSNNKDKYLSCQAFFSFTRITWSSLILFSHHTSSQCCKARHFDRVAPAKRRALQH